MNPRRARTDKLLRTDLDDEVVIYDPERKQAHCLNKVALAVWNHADGTGSIDDLQKRVTAELGVPVGEAEVWLAVKKLERAHLLMAKLTSATPVTRREAIGKGARIGAAVMATPLIASALVPVAAAAQSPLCGTSCSGFTCGASGVCFCDTSVEGVHFCHPPELCSGLQPCNATTDCPLGSACLAATCCAGGVCIPGCPPGAGPTPALHGQTTNGFFP